MKSLSTTVVMIVVEWKFLVCMISVSNMKAVRVPSNIKNDERVCCSFPSNVQFQTCEQLYRRHIYKYKNIDI